MCYVAHNRRRISNHCKKKNYACLLLLQWSLIVRYDEAVTSMKLSTGRRVGEKIENETDAV